MTSYKYKGFTIMQPTGEKLVITKGTHVRCEYPTDHVWEMDEMRTFIDQYGSEIFGNGAELTNRQYMIKLLLEHQDEVLSNSFLTCEACAFGKQDSCDGKCIKGVERWLNAKRKM